ncbi:MAG: PAS domain S-box protein [Ginsengibacter sp.]
MVQAGNNISILLVENNPKDQVSLKKNLLDTNLVIENIDIVTTLKEAGKAIKKKTYSLIFLDLALPESSNLKSFTNLAQVNSGIPVIVLAGMGDTKVSLKALSLGAQDFLIKGDYNINILEKTILYSIERKKNLEIIEENAERFNLVSMATHDIVWDWNLKTGEVYSSRADWKIILKTVEDSEDGNPEGLLAIHPDDRAKVKKMRERIFLSKTQGLFEIECRILEAEDKYSFVQDRGYVIRDKGGIPVRLIGATQDITQRKDAEQKVLLSELRFKSLVQNGSDLIAILDNDANYIYVSPTSERILGYEPEFFTGKNAFAFIHPDDIEGMHSLFAQMRSVGSVDSPPYRFVNAKGKWRWLETNIINLMEDEAVQGIVANSRDITERKLAEEKVAYEKIMRQKEITEAIISAQENERSQIGRELHDNVNQLLGASRLYIDMASKDAANRADYLKSSSTYTLNAINEIRKLSKTLITPSFGDISLVESVKDISNDVMQVHPLKIEFSASGFEEENLNEKFKLNLFRIVQEQINNTIKHAQASLMRIDFKETKDQISVSISDNGVGFDTSVSRKGVGINNLVSRAELYKGKVSISSAPHEGCAVTITFKKNDLLTNGDESLPK